MLVNILQMFTFPYMGHSHNYAKMPHILESVFYSSKSAFFYI